MKYPKAFLSLAAALLLGGLSSAAPMAHNHVRQAARLSASASDRSVVVLMIPLGDAPLCAAGFQMPDCAFLSNEPQLWMEITEVNGVVISEKIVVGPSINQ